MLNYISKPHIWVKLYMDTFLCIISKKTKLGVGASWELIIGQYTPRGGFPQKELKTPPTDSFIKPHMMGNSSIS